MSDSRISSDVGDLYIQRIFSVLKNLNGRHESLCCEMCCHFPPIKKHTKNSEKDFLECIFTYIDDIFIEIKYSRSTWVAQSVERPTSAQVMICWLTSSSPASGSVLTARSLLWVLCLPLSLLLSHSHSVCLSLSLSLKNK